MAQFDTSSIENFESMTPEQKVEALLKAEIPESVDLSGYVKKSVFDAKAAEASDLSKKLKGKMTEDEQKAAAIAEEKEAAEKEREALLARVAELEKNSALKEHALTLTGLGFDEKLAGDTATAIVEGDAAKLFANVKKFLDGYRQAIEKELMDKTPGVGGNGGTGGKDTDTAVEKAKALMSARNQVGKGYTDVISKYAK